MDAILEGESSRARLALLLQHFSELKDDREPWRIVYPLKEVLLLVTCGTIASCDDFDDIVAWGEHHLIFCGSSRISITAFPASVGSAALSTGSIQPCLGAVLRAGSRRFGQDGTISSLSTGRRRAARMTTARVLRPCTRSAPMPRPHD